MNIGHPPPEQAGELALEQVLEKAKGAFRIGDLDRASSLVEGFSTKAAAACRIVQYGPQPSERPVASVVLVSHRSHEILPHALRAIEQQCPAQKWEVILVNNGNDALFEAGRQNLSAFVGVEPPFPLGCSAGRNIGAAYATGAIVLFLDDDGTMEAGCAASIIACVQETEAVAVRGRVVPRTTRSAPHYDLGPERIPSFADCEGISAWRRDVFLEAGGFHPLLAGHEGIELCARLWPDHGPFAFVYEPSAVLVHDFAESTVASAEKASRYARNRALAESGGKRPFDIHLRMQEIAGSARQLYMSTSALRAPRPAGGAAVSVITTARNARPFVEEYSAGWMRQTQRDFQLVYVDDGSQDGTAEAIRRLWSGDSRLTLIERPAEGRGAALNAALAAARHDICLIADADDIPIPSRVARTVDFFEKNPKDDCVSFVVFTEVNLFRIGPPSPLIADMSFRSLFDMPATFPTFAFRSRRFTQAFDEGLQGGIDCDWLRRNMEEAGVSGKLVPYPLVYYRRHGGQITAKHNPVQRATRSKLLEYSFSRLAGPLSEEERRFVEILIDTRRATYSEHRLLGRWLLRVIKANDRSERYPGDLFRRTLLDRFEQIKVLPTDAQKLNLLREEAERHIQAGDYRKARRALKKALRVKGGAEIRARLRAASRFNILRRLVKSWLVSSSPAGE